METFLYSSLTFFLLLTLLHSPPSSAAFSASFLRDRCNTTLYPTLCYTSLSRHASTTNSSSSSSLARTAIAVSLSTTRRASSYFSTLTHHSDFSPNRRAASAVRDCSSTFSDAVDQIRGSLNQMRQLGAAGKDDEAMRFQLSNVQTWMSAALTNEDTCTDGFEGVSDDGGELKADVAGWVDKASKLTSNALALVNYYASTLN